MFFTNHSLKRDFVCCGCKALTTATLHTEMLWATMYYLVTHHHPKTNGLFGLKYIWILKEKKKKGCFKANWSMYMVSGHLSAEFVRCFLKPLTLFKYI